MFWCTKMYQMQTTYFTFIVIKQHVGTLIPCQLYGCELYTKHGTTLLSIIYSTQWRAYCALIKVMLFFTRS